MERFLGLGRDKSPTARFDRLMRRMGAFERRTPVVVRNFPFNVLLWDLRRRVRKGIPLV